MNLTRKHNTVRFENMTRAEIANALVELSHYGIDSEPTVRRAEKQENGLFELILSFSCEGWAEEAVRRIKAIRTSPTVHLDSQK